MSPNELHISVNFAEIAAGTDEVWYATVAAPGEWVVNKAYFTPATNRTANDTNYTDISVEAEGTEIASEQTTTGDLGNLTAGTPVELVLSNAVANPLGQGDTIALKKTDAGTGVALDGTFDLYLEKRRI